MKNPMCDHSFYDFSTMGERGQVVIPSKIRKSLGIKAGERILVIGGVKGVSAVLVNAKHIAKYISRMQTSLNKIGKKMLVKNTKNK
ncbi:MAG: AbrB/MazE/SpoVT family DNA-binding domain-containing protein [Candidatus Margulisiibacteriota bacterium]